MNKVKVHFLQNTVAVFNFCFMILVLFRVSRPIRYLKNYGPIRYLNLFSKFPFTPSLYHLETYPERYQSSRLKLFAEIVSSFQVLTFFAKSSILDVFSRLWIRFSHISSNTGTVLWGNYMVFNFSGLFDFFIKR